MATAASSIPVKHIDDITECSICKDNFTDPRVLPCIHTYCLKCISEWGKEAKPGDNLGCPLCRKQFIIPQQGFNGLPKNILIDKLLDLKMLCEKTCTVPTLCDMCGTEKDEGAKGAKLHCLFCQQSFCEKCGERHNKLKVLSHHKLIELADQSGIAKLLSELPTFCDEHGSEPVKVYCVQCEIAVCVMCYLESHNSHKCTDLKKISQQLRENILGDIAITGERVQHCELVLEKIDSAKAKLVAELAEAEVAICAEMELIKRFAEQRKLKLLATLEAIKRTKLKEVENVREELESRLVEMKSFKNYSEEVESKGTACDVVRQAGGLHQRATQLRSFDPLDYVKVNFKYTTVTFKPSNVADDFLDSVTGCLAVKDSTSAVLPSSQVRSSIISGASTLASNTASARGRVPTLAYAVPNGSSVVGITVLTYKLYVIRFGSNEIGVHDLDKRDYLYRITIPGLSTSPRGIASCSTNNCFYVSDRVNEIVFKVTAGNDRNYTVTNWTVSYGPGALSVTAASNVLVVSQQLAIIHEYKSSGTLVRAIALQSGITQPVYAIELPNKMFLLSHIGGSLHRVCIVGADGNVVHSYGGSPGSDPEQLNQPRGLTVVSHGNILVADRLNNRIVILDSRLNSIGMLPVSVNDPNTLCFNESRGQLCIGEFKPGTVKVFEHANVAT